MYVLIDLTRLMLLHKHPDRNVLANLAHIECSTTGVTLGVGDYRGTYEKLTMLDLKILYKHTTGADLPGFSRESVLNAVMALFERMEVSDVVPAEVARQAFAVPFKNQQHFKYVKGSDKPTQPSGIFFPDAVELQPSDAEIKMASVYVAPMPPPVYVAPPPAPPKVPGQARAARAEQLLPGLPGVGSGAGANTLTARIYAFCNEQKAINDASETKCDLDSVRKGCAKALIDQGVNPSTARRQTMEWMNSL